MDIEADNQPGPRPSVRAPGQLSLPSFPRRAARWTPAVLACALLLAAAPATAQASAAAAPNTVAFTGALERRTSEGHVQVAWEPARDPDGLTFELQSAANPAFTDVRVRYRGPDHASFVSGLPDGETWFRVRIRGPEEPAAEAGPWSEPLGVTVRFAPWWQVRTLMLLGIVVFLSTVASVLLGHRAHRQGRLDGGSGDAR